MKTRRLVVISMIAIMMYIPGIFPSFVVGGTIPVTLQTLVLMMSALHFGKDAVYGVLLYLGLGLFLPIYANFASGIVVLFSSPTAGFLLSFPVAAYVISKVYKMTFKTAFISCLVGGIGVVYGIGIGYATAILKFPLVEYTLTMLPFLVVDLVKVGIASITESRLQRVVQR